MTREKGVKRQSLSVEEDDDSRRQRRKFVACQRCHAHKIKCSGDQPCAKCLAVGCADECAYASRDRQVKVSENYLDQILAENRRLKGQSVTSADVAEASGPPHAEQELPRPGTDVSDATSIQNPIIGDRAWFHRHDPSSPPLYIGEAACSAFATRFRRFLTGDTALAHIPRTQWEREEALAAIVNEADVQWPSLHHARLLVKIAIHQIGYLYHLMMRKSTLDKLEEVYKTGDFESTTNKCRFFALFAFGQAYSIRSEPTSVARVPGTAYFAEAMSLMQIAPERASITHIETLLLLVRESYLPPRDWDVVQHTNMPQSLFSYYLNRRLSAYMLISNAMRMGLTIGLNHSIPESQLIDPIKRQHRIQIWWTIYIFDRMWGSKMGLPMQISDEDIHVDLPSTVIPVWRHEEELSDADYMTANVKLAGIVGETITKLYSRRKYQETFLQRVQKLLKALKNWLETLPESLKLNMEDLESSKKPVVSLHMAFNQCVILTTRPTLLHLLFTLRKNEAQSPPVTGRDSVSQPVLTLSEACIHAARHSHSMILTRWINGTMPTFGYFHAHYLFSSALILAMSSFVPIGSPSDMSGFDSALDLLRSMTENGNLAAAEFYHSLAQVNACLRPYRGTGSLRPRRSDAATDLPTTNLALDAGAEPTATGPLPAIAGMGISSTVEPSSAAIKNISPGAPSAPVLAPDSEMLPGAEAYTWPIRDPVNGYTTEMAFLEPTMQDFLAQSDIDLGLLHPVDTFLNETEHLYTFNEL